MRFALLSVFALSLFMATDSPAAVSGYYHQPAAGSDRIVFVSESDLWTVPTEGGIASRLTTHAEPKLEPAISPDGRWLAFSGSYDGGRAVYVMPVSGGAPKRLTFESGYISVQGWTPEGEVLYATNDVPGPAWFTVLRAVDPDTLAVRELPLMDAREAAFANDGTIYFTRFGLALSTDNAREYRGGAMAQLWRFHPDSDDEAERLLPDFDGNLEQPMWWDSHLYVLSDANGGAGNLWRLNADGSDPTQLTFHEDFEVRSPSLADGRIVYQHGADLRVFDIATGEDLAVAIELASDRAQGLTRWLEAPLDFLESARLDPNAERVAITARGQVALAGTDSVRRIDLQVPERGRAREAVAGPDGEWVYAIVDVGAEQEIWRFPADGRGPGEALTDDGETQREGLLVSPDGRYIVHHDRPGRLWLLDLESGRNRLLEDSMGRGYAGIVWSADSQMLAVVRPDTSIQRRQLVLIEIPDGTTHALTSDRYESFSPSFSPDGQWLYFLSNRRFSATPGSPWGDRNLGPMFDRRTQIYAYALQAGNMFPLAPRTELSAGPDESDDADEQTPAIEFDGLTERLFEVDVAAGNYDSLVAAKDRLYVMDSNDDGSELKTIDFGPDQPELETFASGVRFFELSADRSKLFYATGSSAMYIVDAGGKAPGDLGPHQVRLGDWRLPVRPVEEWRQMFADAWRMQRDFLFDPELRGQDWEAIRARFEPLTARLGDRRELDDLLGQMVAELGVLHSQVRGGDYREEDESGSPAFLGAQLEPVDDGLRITQIYRTDPELPSERSPLARPGVGLMAGDVITAVNGRDVRTRPELAEQLNHQAGQQVRLDFRRGNETNSAVVEPVSAWADWGLRYQDWIQGRRAAVDELADGRIGYLHLNAMGSNDIATFAREFYANIDREGLIIDVRRNRGGNIDSWIIEKLLRRAWMFWQAPAGEPYWNQQQTFRGHLAVLVDPLTYSDGETFSAGVKTLGLGPVIGQRTAGAGVWLSNNNRLVDRGLMRAAQLPQFDAEGRWLVEGHGVEPDIEVENLPHASWKGEDAQLERAVEVLLERLASNPVIQPEAQPIPPRGENGVSP
ncbi:MAG: S41 family peptidase [Wenzhouxiangella sp.]|jgi:tricorn protease|nr:S41 family peptidase [Wenzhouxiangella sp.]